jgi:site-specific recombinase XerD
MKTKMQASGNVPSHIRTTMQQITEVLNGCGIDSLAGIRRETVERWIANELQKGARSARTINQYVTAIKSFSQYLADIELLPKQCYG